MKLKTVLGVALLFFILAPPAHAQYLAPGDIDIFINARQEITRLLNAGFAGEEGRYMMQAAEFYGALYFWLWADILTDEELSAFRQKYMDFMAQKPPAGAEQMFSEIGWQNNGHQKFWTILFGFACTVMVLEGESPYGSPKNKDALYARLFEIIDRQDIYAINSRLADIKSMN
jgi:hypothetical protein